MRIGFVTDNYKPYVSGVINFISLNRQYLEAHGHETWVFAFGTVPDGPGEPRVVYSPGVRVRGTDGFRLGIGLPKRARHLLETMDVVHIDDPFFSGRFAVTVCRKHGIPVVFTNHSRVDLYPDYFLKAFPHGSLDEPMRVYLRRFCRRVDVVISPTESVAHVLRDMGVDVPIRIVRNGVDIGRFLEVSGDGGGSPRRDDRTALGFDADALVFGYSGRLSPEKNLETLVRAFAIAAQQQPEIRLLLIGDGPSRDSLEASVRGAGLSERVVFAGMVPYARMPQALSMCDVWASASLTEVDPLTVIEAMAAGLPVIAATSPGMSDTVVPGVTGLLASPDDAAAFAECMIRLARNPGERLAMGAAASSESQRYRIEATGAEMLEIYESLAGRRLMLAGSGV